MPRALRTVTTTTWKMALLAVALAWATPARGQERAATAPDHGQARRYFEEGVALREAGDAEGAIDRLRRAHALAPGARSAYNLAAALVDGGRLVEAQRLLRRVVARREDLLIADAAGALLARIEPRISIVDLRVAGASSAHRVMVDGAPVELGAQGAREIAMNPGAHRIEVQDAAGVVLARRDLELSEGERLGLTLRPVASPGAPIASASPAARRGRRATPPGATSVPADAPESGGDETWLWVGLGTGAAVVIAIGAVAAGLALGGQGGGTPSSGDLPPVIVRGRDG